MKRVKCALPEWDGPYKGWAQQWVRKNYWKVRAYFGSREDALQECALLFYYIKDYYGDEIMSRAHLMALYQTTVMRSWIHYARRAGRLNDIELLPFIPENPERDVEYPDAELYTKLCRASKQLLYVLEVIATAPLETLEVLLAPKTSLMMDQQIKRLLRIRSKRNLMKELKRLCSL